jgi:hypothetical protein
MEIYNPPQNNVEDLRLNLDQAARMMVVARGLSPPQPMAAEQVLAWQLRVDLEQSQGCNIAR